MLTDANRKVSIIAYFLSEYNEDALRALGYSTYTDAFRYLSALFGKTNNYMKLRRDEFDALNSSPRQGFNCMTSEERKAKRKLGPYELLDSIDVMAGYDMVSFESTLSVSYDRFIEVKSASNSGFYWLKNEYDTARRKGEKYYLYLVDLRRVDEPGYAPEIIANPAEIILQSHGWFVEPQSYYLRRVR